VKTNDLKLPTPRYQKVQSTNVIGKNSRSPKRGKKSPPKKQPLT
jgi:hypothetical protein